MTQRRSVPFCGTPQRLKYGPTVCRAASSSRPNCSMTSRGGIGVYASHRSPAVGTSRTLDKNRTVQSGVSEAGMDRKELVGMPGFEPGTP